MKTNRNPEKKTDRQTKTNQRIRDLERGVKTHREKETKRDKDREGWWGSQDPETSADKV